MRLWLQLVRLLDPDVIVASVTQRHVDEIRFEWNGGWRVMHTIDRQNPYVLKARSVVVGPTKHVILVFGRAAQKPFATIDAAYKRRAGAAVLEHHAG